METSPATLPVTLFSQARCPDSARVRACLLGGGVAFIERNVTGDLDAARALMATGTFATPVVLAGDRVVAGVRLVELARTIGFRCRCDDAG